jgi:hypothetical protein
MVGGLVPVECLSLAFFFGVRVLKAAHQARSVLFVLHQMGTLDHAVSLCRQLTNAGAEVHFALGEDQLELPAWVNEETAGVTMIDDPLEAIAERRYDAVVMQMPYDDLKDPVWSTIGPADAFIVYSGYSVWIVEWEHGGHGLPFYQRCSLILASSKFEQEAFAESPFAPAAVAWSGDPLMYEMVQSSSNESSSATILWTPHWTETWVDGNPGFASWKVTVHDVLASARKNSQAKFVVRGHPLMRVEGEDRVSKKAARAFNELLDLPNVRSSSSSMRHDMLESTAHLTDGVGIIAYYSTTAKPMAVVRLGRRWPPYNAAGRALVNASTTVHDSKSIRRWLDAACEGSLEPDPRRVDLVSQLFPLQDVSPGEFLLRNLPVLSQKSASLAEA